MNLSKTSLLFVLLSFMFFTCSKEETPEPVKDNELTGDWLVTAIDYAGSSTTSYQGMSLTSDFTGTGYDMDLIISFADQPKTYTSAGDYSIELTTTYQGQTTTSNWTNQGFIGGGSWSLAGKELTIISQDGTEQTATILEMTPTMLKLGYNMVNSSEQNGASVVAEIEGTYTFQRQ